MYRYHFGQEIINFNGIFVNKIDNFPTRVISVYVSRVIILIEHLYKSRRASVLMKIDDFPDKVLSIRLYRERRDYYAHYMKGLNFFYLKTVRTDENYYYFFLLQYTIPVFIPGRIFITILRKVIILRVRIHVLVLVHYFV